MAINLLRRRREKIRKQNILDDALNEYDEFEIREEDLINAEPTKDMTAQVNIPIFYLTNGTMKEKLEKLINAENQTPVQVFTKLNECVEKMKAEALKIFLVTDMEPSSELVESLESLQNIDSLFVFTQDEQSFNIINQKSRVYLINWCKDDRSLTESLRRSREEFLQQSSTFSVYNKKEKATRDLAKESGSFLFFQLFKSVLKDLPQTPEAKKTMVNTCRNYYRGNLTEMKNIEDFDKNYRSEDAINWYTKEGFVYKFINKALRTEDIDVLYQFRFYIIDLSIRLEEECEILKAECKEPLKVYRGQKLGFDEIQQFQKSVGNLISTNGYLSTSRVYESALEFALKPAKRKEIVKVMFEYEVNFDLVKSVIAADVQKYSDFAKEAEVLFDIGASFQINSCEYDKSIDLWRIKLGATDQGEAVVAEYMKYQREKMAEANLVLLFGNLLLEMGEHAKAERYFDTILKSSEPNDEEIACIYFNFGRTNRLKGDFHRAINCYHRAYELHVTARPKRLASAAKTLNGLGIVYIETGRLLKADACFHRAMDYYKIAIPKTHPDTATTLINLGIIDCYRKNFRDAKQKFVKAKKIYDEAFPVGHQNRAFPRINLGNIYFKAGDYEAALEEYKEALKTMEASLPKEHPDIARTLNNIAVVYRAIGDPIEAKNYLDRVDETLGKTLSTGHPLIVTLAQTKARVEKDSSEIIIFNL